MATAASGVLAGSDLRGLTLRLLNNIDLRPVNWGELSRSIVAATRTSALRREVVLLGEVGKARDVGLELQRTVPVGPWRCLPMITSALPWTSSISACHLKCSSVPTRGSRLLR